jgi:hydrogenase/urease accessory protein HupE
MKDWRLTAVLIGVAWMVAGSASADIAFPARLDVVEREPGLYDISFTLPIVEGRKLRAEPRMPPTCVESSPREVGVSSGGYTSTWSVRCEPPSLTGEAILIEGLLGTQTDLAFTLTMLDGRSYSRILRPAMLGQRPRGFLVAAGSFAAGHFLAQWLGGQGWLEVSPVVRDLLVWTTVAAPAIRLAGGGGGWKNWLQPLWPTAMLLGLLFGGAQPEALPTEGLSNAEQLLALVVFSIGVGVAMLLMVAAALELRTVIEMVGGGAWREKGAIAFGYVVGIIAVAMVVALLVGISVDTGGGVRAPLEFALLAAVLGPTLTLAGRGGVGAYLGFLALAAAGMALGLARVPLPSASLLTLGSLLVLGGALAFQRHLGARWALALAAVAVPAHSWSTAAAVAENLSRSTAVTIGAVLVVLCVFHAALSASSGLGAEDLWLPVRFLGAFVAVPAVAWRLAEYRSWFEREVATEAALGLARLPLLSVGFLIAALILWVRWRRMQGVPEPKIRAVHRFAFVAAFLLLPYGTLAVPNPFFAAYAPRGDGARLIMSRVLEDTYRALNIKDENELYDTLAESVTVDLVGDLYLDNRRRLTAGTRQGTEVTIRGVSVLDIGDPTEVATAEGGYSYDCRWAVVARVQHLQHVHHRQQIYSGVLTLRAEENRWKIAGVELHSEDRVVLPWEPT